MNLDYEKDSLEKQPFEHYLKEFQEADPEEMAARTGVSYEKKENGGIFTVKMLGMEHLVQWPSFEIERVDKEDARFSPLESMVKAKVLVMQYLLSGTKPFGTGAFVTYREVPSGELYFRQFDGRCIKRLAFSYGNRQEGFVRAMEALQAQKIKMGDVGYEVEILEGFPVRLAVWEGEEEFPPSAQILFGDQFPASFHTEALAVIGDIIIGTLKKM